jgi:hypothetical protein
MTSLEVIVADGNNAVGLLGVAIGVIGIALLWRDTPKGCLDDRIVKLVGGLEGCCLCRPLVPAVFGSKGGASMVPGLIWMIASSALALLLKKPIADYKKSEEFRHEDR